MDALAGSPLGWLCVGVTVLFGMTVLCMAKKSPAEKAKALVQSLLPASLGLLCVAALGAGGGLVVFCAVSLVSSAYLGGRMLLPVGDKAVLITGSDTGIGHALAKYLDSLGFVVFAGVLNKDGPGAEELRRTCSRRLSLLQLDITNATQVKKAYLKVSEKVQNTGLWGVVNNAGILGFPADGELLPMSTYRQCMEVNFFGAVEVSKTFLPLLRKSQGRLVNMSSMAGGIPLPRYAAYGASKAALSMFSGVMRQELSKWGIKVAAIHPSGFRTGIQGTSDLWDKKEKELMENLPEDTRQDYGEDYVLGLKSYLLHMPAYCDADLSPVLNAILHALLAKRPHGLYTPGKGAYLPLCVFCYFPLWFYDFFISKMLSTEPVPRALRTSAAESKNL
ncbi:17-beta-hydroxysteroid dehydrogenase type 2 isoform X1 [Rissa tridactyla]|uniref:17-beta-hydroxysteroid dehydrogenase type 2 isoform X1 n=1 Tax=Rissa tridactyla TaxID=75485 RepID=UPI0023BB0485|nr:17-beta-hydroxysteroid dehydrogenase type 2 isoform X1 [Rissa tridactyla]XP_054057583.1 17-beta-hydroxysteroid dehydrogenase type 2 isoform X1 [Rissa tridactyla]